MTRQSTVRALRTPRRMRPGPTKRLLVLGVALCFSGQAQARDLHRLSDLLAPTFLAQQFGNVCAALDPSFLRETAGALGSVNDYSEHAKYEVAHTLVLQEVVTVLRRAADIARDAARQALPRARSQPDIRQEQPLSSFCDGPAKRAVRATIEPHDAAHERFLREIQEALE